MPSGKNERTMKEKKLIEQILQQDDRIWNEDKTVLNHILLFELLEHTDEKIIELLFNEAALREKFFVKITGAYVFKTNDFRFFMEENKIDNSYTAYKNRIGLSDGKRFLKDTNDVVLDFPYKDCILEGGQSTEEGEDTYFEYSEKTGKYENKTAKRKEIFFNSVLAHDEIDRLLDHKALVNWKRYTKEGEQEVKEITRDEYGTIRENLIIKGNNLLALHSLKKQYAGKIKLIYIDPPYNPPSNNNSFLYNNNFNHSTWLVFMKNRLEVAKALLKDDGVIQIAIDENEQPYLGVLIDNIFSKEYEKHCITIEHNPRGVIGKNFYYTNEFVYFVFRRGLKVINKIKRDKPLKREFRNNGGESLRTDAKNCFYPILVKNNKIIGFGNVSPKHFHPFSKNVIREDGIIEVYPLDINNIERKWEFASDLASKIRTIR